jgi:nitrate reductase (cytochrome), electron transfer subunit
MSPEGPRPAAVAVGLLLIASAVTAVVAVIVAARRAPEPRHEAPGIAAVGLLVPPDLPIAAEADVFRTTAAMLAIEPAFPRERKAHPRTRATYRFLRAYPGAPPRIPHALSPDEFRTGVCASCHERGGYSLRFAAYVPVTPHPDLGMCLQCHVGDDGVMGLASAAADPNSRCPLCHGPSGGRPRPEASATWPTTVWPMPVPRIPGRLPPPIPHDLQLRGNCVACHAGPSAVADLRTSHPERADCRQCHVAVDSKADDFTRRPWDGGADIGVTP